MAHPNQLGELAATVLALLDDGPATAADLTARLDCTLVAVTSALQRMRRRGLVQVAGCRPSRCGKSCQLWAVVPGASARITRQPTRIDPPLPPETVPSPIQIYRPGVVQIGGVGYESWSGRMPLSAYVGQSSLVGTARWGAA